MKTKLLVIGLLAFAVGFSRGVSTPTPSVSPSVSPSPVVSPSVSPSPLAGPIRITYDPIEYYSTPAQRVKIARVAKKVQETLFSDCTADFLKQTWTKPDGSKTRLTWTNELPVEKAVERVQSSQGVIPVRFYYSRWSSAVAYRGPGNQINLNTKFWSTESDDCEMAGTLAHEMLHTEVGGEFDHSYKWNVEREYTVPYKVAGSYDQYGGNAFKVCCR